MKKNSKNILKIKIEEIAYKLNKKKDEKTKNILTTTNNKNKEDLNKEKRSSFALTKCTRESDADIINEDIINNDSFLIIESNYDYKKNSIENNLITHITELNKIKEIYINLIREFTNEKNSKNLKYKNFAYDYIKFLFNEITTDLILYFKSSLEVNKFIIYQVYLFISLIYLNNNINEYKQISYRSIFQYSLQNYSNIINYIEKTLPIKDIDTSLHCINKIIYSIMKIISPNIPSNKNIKAFLYPNFNNNIVIKNASETNPLCLMKSTIESIIINSPNFNENEIIINKNNLQYNNTINLINLLKENCTLVNQLYIIENNYNKLPLIDNKYKYTVILDLDETIIHYCEEDHSYYAKIRYGTEDFLNKIKEFSEIIIVSNSSKEYSDVIINSFNKNNKIIDYTIYNNNNNITINNLNRNINKTIFICHSKYFLNAPLNNIIQLKFFLGEENDNQMILLYKELVNLFKLNVNDVSTLIPIINKKIKRYSSQ